MKAHHDALETREPALREAALMAALPAQVAHAQAHASAFAEALADVDARQVTNRDALARLPVIRKTNCSNARRTARRRSVRWVLRHRLACARAAAGARRVLPVARARSTSPRAAAPITGAWRARCTRPAFAPATWCTTASAITSRPAGSMMETRRACDRLHRVPRRRRQHRAAAAGDRRAASRTAYCGTPSFLRILLEKAAETGRSRCHRSTKALVGGEAFPPALRDWLA